MFVLRSLFVWIIWTFSTIFFGTVAPISYFVPPRGRWWFLCADLWGRSLLVLAGIRVEREGPPVTPPCVYVANHESLLDIPVLLSSLPYRARFLAKKILFAIPFVGWNIRLAGFIPIDRSNRRGAAASLERAAERARTGCPVLVFPEETRSPDGILLPFQRGGFLLAMKAGIPLVPVGIEGTRHLLRKGGIWFRSGQVRVRWGEPIPTAGLHRHDREDLMARARAEIQRLRGGGAAVPKDVADRPGKEELREAEKGAELVMPSTNAAERRTAR